MARVTRRDFQRLLEFRVALREFQHWSEDQAEAAGLTHVQHQLLVAIKGHPGNQPPTVGDLASYLLLRPHSTVELIDRAEGAGLVERTPDRNDGRMVRVRLTKDGDRIVQRLTKAHLSRLHELAAVLDELVARHGAEAANGSVDRRAMQGLPALAGRRGPPSTPCRETPAGQPCQQEQLAAHRPPDALAVIDITRRIPHGQDVRWHSAGRWRGQVGGEALQFAPCSGRIRDQAALAELLGIQPARCVSDTQYFRGLVPVPVRGAHQSVNAHRVSPGSLTDPLHINIVARYIIK
jgi:DNA-binding MarR family transcriptional regulator